MRGLLFMYQDLLQEVTMGLFAPVPQPQSSQVRLKWTLLVSADLTADEITATGGHWRFVPNQGPEAPAFLL